MSAGAARILVVDDEPALLDSMRSYLSHLGHAVTSFGNASAAWESLASESDAPSIAIVDLTLRDMPGGEFIRKLLERFPDISVLIMSGYSVSIESLYLPHGARVALLQKPFTPHMLTTALARLLAEEPGMHA